MTAPYFPVEEAPLRMVASLARFGSDFGLGEVDAQFFQIDEAREAYLAAKREAPADRTFVSGDDALARASREEARAWMQRTFTEEHPKLADRLPRDAELATLAEHVQEDFAILHAGEGDAGRCVALDVRFPSGWRPERLRDASFEAIHGPVPDFPTSSAASRGMVRAMVDRGPYVRFVWTLTPDDALDQHPEVRDRVAGWERPPCPCFRVERQVTVPLPETRSSVFLIRVYLTPLHALAPWQLDRLVDALDVMPEEVRRYKNLPRADELDALMEADDDAY
ncbi:MAG: heme-dependent oxidative N-demethylase subunit alpha family protein [Myxococcota bacterium]